MGIFKILFVDLTFVVGAGLSMRIESWAKRNKKLSLILSYAFFPIYLILKWIGWKINQEVCFRSIRDGKKENDNHLIFSMCYHYMKFLSVIHKWKKFISKRWFYSIMEKHKLILYDFSIDDKDKTDYSSFKSHLGIYGEGYIFMGGGRLNAKGSTTITIES